jgi:hypothetical protein
MSRTVFSVEAVEKSTYVVTVSFTNKAGTPVTPDSCTWSLTTSAGAIVNARTAVNITPLATSVDIVLSGLDLALQTGETNEGLRLLTVQAVYTSTEGSSLPLKEEYLFRIRGLTAVT